MSILTARLRRARQHIIRASEVDGVVYVTTKSPLSGTKRELELDANSLRKWIFGKALIQDCFPNLTLEQRELLMTGYTQEDWDIMFPDDLA